MRQLIVWHKSAVLGADTFWGCFDQLRRQAVAYAEHFARCDQRVNVTPPRHLPRLLLHGLGGQATLVAGVVGVGVVHGFFSFWFGVDADALPAEKAQRSVSATRGGSSLRWCQHHQLTTYRKY